MHADPVRDATPLERMRARRDQRKRKIGWLVIVFMVPGLAFPLLSRRPAKSPKRELRQACAARCALATPQGVQVMGSCFEACLQEGH